MPQCGTEYLFRTRWHRLSRHAISHALMNWKYGLAWHMEARVQSRYALDTYPQSQKFYGIFPTSWFSTWADWPYQPELLMLPLRHTVRVYSGIAPPQALLDAMGFSGPQTKYARPASPPSPGQPPPIPPRPAVAPVPVYEGIYEGQVYDDAPPSYEDAIADELGPVDGPRREYNPPDAPADGRTSGTDVKSPVGSGKDSERVFPNSGPSNHSTESLDMLPSTPSDSRPSTACVTPAPQRGEAHPTPAERKSDEQPSQYQPTPQDQLQTPEQTEQTTQRRPSRPDIRTINLGVPKRKPVPGSPNSKHPPTS